MRYIIAIIFLFFASTALAAPVKTNALRVNTIKSYIEGQLLFPVEADLTILDATPAITIRGQRLTRTEYNNIKAQLIDRVKTRTNTHFDNYEQFFAWIEIFNRECGRKRITGFRTIDSLNAVLESGC